MHRPCLPSESLMLFKSWVNRPKAKTQIHAPTRQGLPVYPESSIFVQQADMDRQPRDLPKVCNYWLPTINGTKWSADTSWNQNKPKTNLAMMGTYFTHVKGKGAETSTLNQICYRQLYKDGHAMGEETQTWMILWCLWPPSHCKCLLWSSSEPLSLLFSLQECN